MISENQAMLDKLKMKSTKSVNDFMDHIDITLNDIEEVNEDQSVFFFLQGATPGLKCFLEEDKDLTTREDFLKAACAYERAHPQMKQETSFINVIEGEESTDRGQDSEEQQLVAAINNDNHEGQDLKETLEAITQSIN